eukprot:TRINITY_DN712_c0_g1_i4.p1 TRINITY_DN712_c0_g1~~TRINITY_DN712_c0_g1_i4.p1  ORF type:complete len:132 (+),score=49.12 TRINITY_DN712_c0_g1_i4:84-479(+)
MSFIILLLMIFEWVWCVVMPIVGSLYLVSRKYHQENAPKENLFRHWCYYWIIYFVLRLGARVLNIFLYKLEIMFYVMRVIILCVLVTPKLDLTTNVAEQVLSRSGDLDRYRKAFVKMISQKVLRTADNKTE